MLESPHRGAGVRPVRRQAAGQDGRSVCGTLLSLGSTMHRAGTRQSRATTDYITSVNKCQALWSISFSHHRKPRMAARTGDHAIPRVAPPARYAPDRLLDGEHRRAWPRRGCCAGPLSAAPLHGLTQFGNLGRLRFQPRSLGQLLLGAGVVVIADGDAGTVDLEGELPRVLPARRSCVAPPPLR